ncbi:MAG: carboxypeptidase regulatory-like domain-containing protein [Fischerella sp. CENA71]|nr:carboxypeptidase regulatory-like domain-containing protein [Fischerella sp. CENA71]
MLKMSVSNQQIVIAGKVLEGESEKTISGAIVQIIEMPETFKAILSLKALQYSSQWEKMLERPDRKITTSDGDFHFINLPPGEYLLETSLPASATRYKNGRKTVNISAAVDGKILTTMIEIFLLPTGIKGKITDADEPNQAIINAKVQIQGCRDSTLSDQKGNYRLLGLESSKSGQHTVTLIVSAIGYQQVSKSLVIQLGEVIAEQNFALKHK